MHKDEKDETTQQHCLVINASEVEGSSLCNDDCWPPREIGLPDLRDLFGSCAVRAEPQSVLGKDDRDVSEVR